MDGVKSMIQRKTILGLFLLFLIAGASAINVYVPITQTTTKTGHVVGTVRCHHNLFSYEMILQNFTDNTWHSVFVSPDGKFDFEVDPGDYLLILLDGDTGHPEYRNFTAVAGQISQVHFKGHAISTDSGTPIPTPTPTVSPTPTPTVSPTPTPTPVCHTKVVCTSGYWELPKLSIQCVPIWHPPECHTVTICE